MSAKVVFHIDWEKEERLVMALNNITNLLKAVSPEEAAVYVLANGAAVKLFQRESAFQYAPDIQRLFQQGVRFLICSNSLNNFGILREDLLGPCEAIDAGIVELIRFQAEGYAYIKP
ncbi:MAG: DsrE family protein [Deltaproteobacteria bacterium]|nr:DsrE family protein [Deltaproteobacteria bacterium]